MFNTDKPIKYLDEDLLDRRAFAKQLASAIYQFQTKENYTISLQGAWGCGKTSVLNMIIDEINRLNLMGDDGQITVVQFNPWNFTTTSQLLDQFFITLSNTLKVGEDKKKVKEVGEALEKYSSALEYSEYIPVVGPYLKVLPKLSKEFGKTVKERVDKQLNDIPSRKEMVEKALLKLDKKILIIIDDIDRLPNEQILLIFQLVNAVAGFPNTIYLLSYDKDIVARALANAHNCNGEEYLEKIIQIPFDVPPVDSYKIQEILSNKIREISVDLDDTSNIYYEHQSIVFRSCVYPFIKTLRDINRYCNVLNFQYAAVKEEVNFIDMAAITALQVFAPTIYEWIRDNKFTLAGGYDGQGISLNNVPQQRADRIDEFKTIYPDDPEGMLGAIAALFPKFSNQVSYSSNFRTSAFLHQAMRIADEKKFDLYFSLSLSNIKISRKEVDQSLFIMEEDELRIYFENLHERNLVYSYVTELELNLSRIPENRINMLLSVILFKEGSLDRANNLISREQWPISVYLLEKILMQISNNENRFKSVLILFSKSDFIGFQKLLYLLHITELSYNRIAENARPQGYKVVGSEELSQLEKLSLDRIKGFAKITNLLDWQECRRAILIWCFLDKETYSEYICKTISDDICAVRFLTLFVTEWESAGKTVEYELQNETFTEWIDTPDAIQRIKNVQTIKEFWDLDEHTIELAVAFYLLAADQREEKRIHVSIVRTEVEKWRGAINEDNI